MPAALAGFAESHLGPIRAIEDRSWDHGESEVWLLCGDRGRAVLKRYRQARKFRQESTAYREWLPLPGHRTPRLLGMLVGDERALLLEALPGRPLAASFTAPTLERRLHTRAGAFLSALHGTSPEDRDPVPLATAFERRVEEWSRRATGIVDRRLTEAARSMALEALPALAAMRRVTCHRDFTPRNWLHDPATPEALAFIDFEHARPDLYLVDLERMWSSWWRERPDLREAFLQGYGRNLSDDEESLLERLAALAGLSTIVWAREHGDEAFEEEGRRSLARLGLARAD